MKVTSFLTIFDDPEYFEYYKLRQRYSVTEAQRKRFGIMYAMKKWF